MLFEDDLVISYFGQSTVTHASLFAVADNDMGLPKFAAG
jgi:hypothetical protein